MQLFTYWRSSTAYRVRIALNIKEYAYDSHFISLPGQAHRMEAYLALNPQGLVPTLVDDGHVITQSLTILEYLEEQRPTPPLLPTGALQRAYVRALAHLVACDIHPLNNVRVLRYLEDELGVHRSVRDRWYAHWIAEGLSAFEALLNRHDHAGAFCCGDEPSMADVCLIPQLYNARRFDCPLDAYPRILRIAANCERLPAFARAHPERQPDSIATTPAT